MREVNETKVVKERMDETKAIYEIKDEDYKSDEWSNSGIGGEEKVKIEFAWKVDIKRVHRQEIKREREKIAITKQNFLG